MNKKLAIDIAGIIICSAFVLFVIIAFTSHIVEMNANNAVLDMCLQDGNDWTAACKRATYLHFTKFNG